MFKICVWKRCYKEWVHRKKEHCVLIFIHSAALRLSRDIWLLPYIFIFRRKFYAEKNLGSWREEKGGEGRFLFHWWGKAFFLLYYTEGEEQWGRRLEGCPNTAACQDGWRRVTRRVWFWPWWTGRTARLFCTIPVALTGAAQLRADGICSCC